MDNYNKINYLHCFIKEQVKLKGRKVKIVVDWDDCLQPLKPAIIHRFSKTTIPFDLFFKIFWEDAVIEPSTSSGGKVKDILISLDFDDEKQRETIKELEKVRTTIKNDPDIGWSKFMDVYGVEERFKVPFTTIAEDLLLALKEDLISDLLIISSFSWSEDEAGILKDKLDNEGKHKKKFKTFGKFDQSRFELTELKQNEEGKWYPDRWERINTLCPDFDIFIDDKKSIIEQTNKHINKNDKIYILPNYNVNRKLQKPNIYHLETSVSDLKDEDFTKAVQEYKMNQNIKQEGGRREAWKQRALGYTFGLLTAIILYGGYWIIKRLWAKREPNTRVT